MHSLTNPLKKQKTSPKQTPQKQDQNTECSITSWQITEQKFQDIDDISSINILNPIYIQLYGQLIQIDISSPQNFNLQIKHIFSSYKFDLQLELSIKLLLLQEIQQYKNQFKQEMKKSFLNWEKYQLENIFKKIK